MENSAVSRSVRRDFIQIIEHYRGEFPGRVQEQEKHISLLRLVHRFGVVASILSNSLPKQRPQHRRVFLQELSSDAIHLLHSVLVGDIRAARFYLRSAIENFWRHMYFMDHPIEYGWSINENEYFISIDELRNFCRKKYENDRSLIVSFQRIEGGYRKLSGFVHGSGAAKLQLEKQLSAIRVSSEPLKEVVHDLRTYGRDIVLLLLVLHANEMAKIYPGEERYVIDYLDRVRKRLRLDVLAS